MFRKIWGWFSRKKELRLDIYEPKERQIYHYFNGKEMVHADPMELWTRLMDCGPELSVDIKVANSISKDAPAARKKVRQKIRDIFGLVPFEQGGLTIQEADDLLDHFGNYVFDIKKNSPPLPTMPNTTEESVSTSKADESTTSPTLPSGFPESVSENKGPQPLPEESQSEWDSSCPD